MNLVDGATRLYGIVGDPIAQVKSPEVFTARFRAAGLNAVLVPMEVKPERFDEALVGLKALANLHGIIATLPYKARVLRHVDRVLPTGKRVGAINAMRREPDGSWVGDMFDGKGLVAGMRASGVEPRGKHVMLLGAGGAGSAIADALGEAGAQSIRVFDREPAKARQLVERIRQAHPANECRVGDPSLEGCDVLINATPVGMSPGDGLPAAFDALPARLFVVDIVPRSEETRLLASARAAGCRTMAGRAMVAGQVDEMLRFFGVA
ncbi:MAG TPA: NAD(P)-binding domain-containing protein [Burkholderiales bacterium]|nr:NAD(P)-binding domain-containing protein [Burkholderiales bacterium]